MIVESVASTRSHLHEAIETVFRLISRRKQNQKPTNKRRQGRAGTVTACVQYASAESERRPRQMNRALQSFKSERANEAPSQLANAGETALVQEAHGSSRSSCEAPCARARARRRPRRATTPPTTRRQQQARSKGKARCCSEPCHAAGVPPSPRSGGRQRRTPARQGPKVHPCRRATASTGQRGPGGCRRRRRRDAKTPKGSGVRAGRAAPNRLPAHVSAHTRKKSKQRTVISVEGTTCRYRLRRCNGRAPPTRRRARQEMYRVSPRVRACC